MPVGEQDLTKLGDMCNTICYWLTAHIAAVAAGALPNSPPEVAQIYQLASKLPQPDPKKWGSIIKGRPDAASGAAGGAAGEGHIAEGAKAPGKRMKWTPELEEQLVRLVDDEDYRSQVLGKEGTRKGKANMAAIARHFSFAASGPLLKKYNELKGIPTDSKPSATKSKKDDEAAAEEAPAKKQKVEAAAPPTTKKEAATPATANGAGWTPAQQQELVRLVESEDARKEAFTKRKLRWKRIAEKFGHKSKACKAQYKALTGKPVPDDED